MHETYGWTRRQIDEEEFEYILAILVAQAKVRNAETEEKAVYIDEVF